jgi:hypothetical protein
MNGIKICSENYINEYCSIEPTSGSATKNYLFDQNQATKWVSEGSNDNIIEHIDITFKNWQGEEINRDFNRIIILNHNLKFVTFEYYNGTDWINIPGAGLIIENEAYTIIEITQPPPIPVSRIRLNCKTTQIANQEKQIGELKICKSILEEPEWLSDFSRNDSMRGNDYRLAGGKLVSWKEWTKVSGKLSIENVSLDNLNILLPYMKQNEFIIVIFYQDFNISDIYEFQIVNAPNFNINRKERLFNLSLSLEEK